MAVGVGRNLSVQDILCYSNILSAFDDIGIFYIFWSFGCLQRKNWYSSWCNYSLNWQHQLCKNPRPNPDIKTLFVDHSCGQPNGARAPSPANNPLLGSLPKAGGFPPLGAHGVSTNFNLLSNFFLVFICFLNVLGFVVSHFNLHQHQFQHPLQVGCLILPQWLIQQFLEEELLVLVLHLYQVVHCSVLL